jgi:hypothetical protein
MYANDSRRQRFVKRAGAPVAFAGEQTILTETKKVRE